MYTKKYKSGDASISEILSEQNKTAVRMKHGNLKESCETCQYFSGNRCKEPTDVPRAKLGDEPRIFVSFISGEQDGARNSEKLFLPVGVRREFLNIPCVIAPYELTFSNAKWKYALPCIAR